MAFAEPSEIGKQWRPLTPAEKIRAEALLELAEHLIRRHVTFTGAEDDPLLIVAKQVSIEMVADALLHGARAVGPTVTTASLDGAAYTAEMPAGTGRAWVLTFDSDLRALFGLSAPQPAYYFGDDPQ